MTGLKDRIASAKTVGAPSVVDRARAGLLAWLGAGGGDTGALADGRAATALGRVALEGGSRPGKLACAEGCAFCCVLTGEDGGLITEGEARDLHKALAPLAGQPDGRAWMPKACAALDPQTRTCRAYDARPMICRAYVSSDVAACEAVAQGTPAPGPGTLGGWHLYLAALGLSRSALKGTRRVATYSLAKLTAAATEGADLDAALAQSRHRPKELEGELQRSKRDLARTARSA